MPDLTARAEEALLGALISDARQLAGIPDLEPGAFTSPDRRAVWAAISRLREIAPGASGPEFADLILATTDNTAITSDYLTQLALSAPTPSAAAAYANLVTEAVLTRDLIAATAGERVPAGAETRTPEIQGGVSYASCLAAARSAISQDTGAPGPAPADERAVREERFLAGVITQQSLTDWIRLDPDILSAPGLCCIYQAALAADKLGEPADELILAWRAARIVAQDLYSAGQITTAETIAARIPPGIIARLTSSRVDALTALEAGRDLLADHARAQIAARTSAARQEHGATPASYDTGLASVRRSLASHGPPPLQERPAHDQPHYDGPQLRQEGI